MKPTLSDYLRMQLSPSLSRVIASFYAPLQLNRASPYSDERVYSGVDLYRMHCLMNQFVELIVIQLQRSLHTSQHRAEPTQVTEMTSSSHEPAAVTGPKARQDMWSGVIVSKQHRPYVDLLTSRSAMVASRQ